MSPYGGYGTGGNPFDPFGQNKWINGGQTIMSGVEQSVHSFGRISQLMQMNFEALHVSFTSLLRFLGGFAILRSEFWALGKTFTLFRFLQLVYIKARRVVSTLLGRSDPQTDLKDAWHDSESTWSWVPLILTAAMGWCLLRYLWRRVGECIWPSPSFPIPLEEMARFQQFQQQQPIATEPNSFSHSSSAFPFQPIISPPYPLAGMSISPQYFNTVPSSLSLPPNFSIPNPPISSVASYPSPSASTSSSNPNDSNSTNRSSFLR